MLKRLIASITVGAVMIGGALVAPAQAGGQTGSNTGVAGPTTDARPASTTVRRLPNLKVFATPVLPYTGKTCSINFNALADGTQVNSVTGCGMKVRFSVPMSKQTVPGGGWATWGSPPNTESATPRVLSTISESQVVLTFSVRSRIVGVEAEPSPFGVHTIDATFRRRSGKSIGTISRDVEGNAGALLFAGKVKSPKKTARVKTLTLESDAAFAIARIRVVRP